MFMDVYGDFPPISSAFFCEVMRKQPGGSPLDWSATEAWSPLDVVEFAHRLCAGLADTCFHSSENAKRLRNFGRIGMSAVKLFEPLQAMHLNCG